MALTGPWDLQALSDGNLESLDVTAFPSKKAPSGGQVLVVPRCSNRAVQAWSLALDLTAPGLQASCARTLAAIPTTSDGLAEGGRVANAFYLALEGASQLPRHLRAPELFDDLTPAVLAVVAQDATSDEALSGVAGAWRRLYAVPTENSP
ncbi:MAG: hypothetical protein GY811_15840 [Myxococcales bacterium]|nr:hypothetical protein [Myxococcales bacterium]